MNLYLQVNFTLSTNITHESILLGKFNIIILIIINSNKKLKNNNNNFFLKYPELPTDLATN